MDLHNIYSISRYEAKLLRRSWLFRLFALLSLGIIVYFQLTMQGNLNNRYQWNMVAMASSIPFVCIYIYNIAQSIIAIFLAGDFLKRDQKLDTAEVIFVRPLSNADYIVGKTWGIISVFVSLNIIALLFAAFVNLFASESPFNAFSYFFYLFTLAIPSLIFILGLSFVIMSLVKNQAVTFVILLGYIGITLFYLGNAEHGAFDFFSITLPNIFSDITGHPNLSEYLTQRISYFVLGIGLLTFTIALVKRIPHHPKKRILLNGLGGLLICIGLLINFLYITDFHSTDKARKLYTQIYQKYNDHDKLNLLAEEIIYNQKGEKIQATAKLTVQNQHDRNLSSVILYLNPSLQVIHIKEQGKDLTFDREGQVIIVKKALAARESANLQITYEGNVSETICYLDVEDEEFYNTQTGSSVLYFGKRYAFVEDELTLLTPEAMWYPTTIPTTNPAAPYNIQKNFIDFTLKVVAPKDKIVLSQGSAKQHGDTTIYTNKQKLQSISLAIGNYERKSITVDSVRFELYHFPGHDYFSAEFTNLKDTLAPIIQELKESFEVRKNRVYPFEKLAFIETPISFTGYVRNWKGHSEMIQPELVFLPERLTTLPSANFKISKVWTRQRGQRRGGPMGGGGAVSEVEIEHQVLRDFIEWIFLSETNYEQGGNQLLNLALRQWNGSSKLNKYDITALYFNFRNFITSQEYPLMDILLNTLLKQDEESQRWRRRFSMDDAQRAAAFLKDHSFEEAMRDKDLSKEVFYEMVKLKGIYLRNYITSQISIAQFNEFMQTFMQKYQFNEVNFSTLNDEFKQTFNINLMDFIPQWYTIKTTPRFIVKDIAAEKVVIDEHTKYLAHFKVHNPTDVDGIISIDIQEGQMWGAPGRGRGGFQQETKPSIHYVIPAKSYKEVKILCDNQPRNININSNIAQNLPSNVMYNFPKIEHETKNTESGIFNTDDAAFKHDPKDIIVDNEDKGFRIIESNQKTTLQSFFKKENEDKYKNTNFWDVPTRWTATIGTNYYGDYINSGYYKKIGNGNNKAVWTAQIEEPGVYEVFIYNANRTFRFRRRQQEEATFQYYTVKHDDGENEVSIETQKDNQQWISLGTFYFSSGEATVTLNDKGTTPNQIIYADAVRWTFRKNNQN